MLTKRLIWKELLTVFLLALLALWSTSARANGDYDAGARKSFLCAYCHGYDGNPLDQRVPRLAGRKPDYITNRIKELKATGAMHESMRQAFLTGELSDQDVANLATFYSRQPEHP
ncbi:MAG: c-type cytochrome [Thiobacillus sp.]|nr:c-type cytochrome [Thiobacillus sp.]